jgi:hypothetical protein
MTARVPSIAARSPRKLPGSLSVSAVMKRSLWSSERK